MMEGTKGLSVCFEGGKGYKNLQVMLLRAMFDLFVSLNGFAVRVIHIFACIVLFYSDTMSCLDLIGRGQCLSRIESINTFNAEIYANLKRYAQSEKGSQDDLQIS